MTKHEIEERLRQKWEAYEQLAGAAHVLRAGPLFWTERALLGLVEALAWRRIEQLGAVSVGKGHGRSTWVDESDLRRQGLDSAAVIGHSRGYMRINAALQT